MTKLNRLAASIIAATTLAICAMGPISAGATYQSQDYWRIFWVKDTPEAPNQQSYDDCSFPAYSGGYKSYCSSISGSNDRKVSVASNVGRSWTITATGYSAVYTSNTGGTAFFRFTGSCTNSITANGTVGYDL